MSRLLIAIVAVLSMLPFTAAQPQPAANPVFRVHKPTMTPVEMAHGETLVYERGDGETLRLKLTGTAARILYTNRDRIPRDESGNDRGNMYRARLLYTYTIDLEVNGMPMTMRRYVGSQESFFEPFVINGVRIWPIGVSDVFEEHGGFLNTVRNDNGSLRKDARLVLQDMDTRICPAPLHPWYIDSVTRNEDFVIRPRFIDIGRCFNGADCFMGAYLGGESHGALDVDMAQNSVMYAPFGLDTQEGIRAEGSRRWPDGSEWRINTGHVIEKLVDDHEPVAGGEPYGIGARRGCWWHPHAHFGFRVYEKGVLYEVDPWIIFWQLFEDQAREKGVLRARMNPLKEAQTGQTVTFRSLDAKGAPHTGPGVAATWTFGDGTSARGHSVRHIFTQPGIYPVTLTLQRKDSLEAITQHITVQGAPVEEPALALSSPHQPAFRPRPVEMLDTYEVPPSLVPFTLPFLARPSHPLPRAKTVRLHNRGGGTLEDAQCEIRYTGNPALPGEPGWLRVQRAGGGNRQQLRVSVDGSRLMPGTYRAVVTVTAGDRPATATTFAVELEMPAEPASSRGVIIDDRDEECWCTPYFWVGHRFHGWGWPALRNAEGYNHFYRMNGKRAKTGEYARFTPDLEAGDYVVWLYERTPYAGGPQIGRAHV